MVTRHWGKVTQNENICILCECSLKASLRRLSYSKLDKMVCPIDPGQSLSPDSNLPAQRGLMSHVAMVARMLRLTNMDLTSARLSSAKRSICQQQQLM